MIFILAGTYDQARKWAKAQNLSKDEWFSSLDVSELRGKENFHVVVLDTAGELPSQLFERLFSEAQRRGRMNRK